MDLVYAIRDKRDGSLMPLEQGNRGSTLRDYWPRFGVVPRLFYTRKGAALARGRYVSGKHVHKHQPNPYGFPEYEGIEVKPCGRRAENYEIVAFRLVEESHD